jgi:hypothetical protein
MRPLLDAWNMKLPAVHPAVVASAALPHLLPTSYYMSPQQGKWSTNRIRENFPIHPKIIAMEGQKND